MKKFFSLLTVFVLALALAVPASALVSKADTEVALSGDTVLPLPDGITLYDLYGAVNSGAGVKIVKSMDSGAYAFIASDFPLTHALYFFATDFDAEGTYFIYENGSWGEPVPFILPKGEYLKPFGSGGMYLSLSEDEISSFVFSEYVCDGSSCPAHDVNIDGICDDCGMTLMSLSRTPVPPAVDVPNKGWVTLYDGSTYKYHVFYADYTYSLRGSIYGSSYRVDADPAVNVIEYESHDGINWTDGTTRTGLTSHFPGLASQTILSSTFNWYTEEGDHFFPETLWGEMAKVTQGEMMGLTQTTVGAMKILTVCGVGCLALLAVLKLFGKRSLISRG